jgi:hypothetical protein
MVDPLKSVLESLLNAQVAFGPVKVPLGSLRLSGFRVELGRTAASPTEVPSVTQGGTDSELVDAVQCRPIGPVELRCDLCVDLHGDRT